MKAKVETAEVTGHIQIDKVTPRLTSEKFLAVHTTDNPMGNKIPRVCEAIHIGDR